MAASYGTKELTIQITGSCISVIGLLISLAIAEQMRQSTTTAASTHELQHTY